MKLKKGKRILALLLIMALAVSLCGCGNTAKKLYGTWETTVDCSSAIEEEMEGEYEDFHQSFEIRMLLEFKEDGTYSMYADEEAAKETFENWINTFVSYSVEVLYDEFEESGMSREDVDTVIQEQYGCSMEEYMLDEIHSELDLDDYVSDMKSDGVFKAKGDKLYLDEDGYDIFKVENDTLTIDIPEGAEIEESEMIEGIDYPLVFTKVVTE